MDKIEEFIGKYSYLSNFEICKLKIGKLEFHSVEQAYQYYKCESQEDKDIMLSLETPSKCKRFSRGIKTNEDFHNKKLEIMTFLVTEKFKQNPLLLKKLLSTKDSIIVEGNFWHDTFWGVCDGEGENHLGKILMEVRGKLK